MSRIGKKPVAIPAGVKIQLNGAQLLVEGPKGKVSRNIDSLVKVTVGKSEVQVARTGEDNRSRSLHGLVRAEVQNMINGVTSEFVKNLLIEGVGFKAQINGKVLQLSLGFSHPIDYAIPEGVKVETPKPTQVVVKGVDRQLVGQVAAEIREYFKPEPYKGKGVRYIDERVRKKKGKAVE